MKRLIIVLAGLSLAMGTCAAASPWKPAGDNIRTRWAADVNPSAPRNEYPRPQMVRDSWMNLNGLWDYGITDCKAEGFSPEGKILVPFAVESSLSGVGRNVGKDNALWYSRTFTLPRSWKGTRVLLHFGAVDWKADIWVNGSHAGTHTGGFDPFSLDITSFLSKAGKQKIQVRVWDGTDSSWQPRGKQVEKPVYIWYTPVTGIWQTVWLESVPEAHIVSYSADASVSGELSVSMEGVALQESDSLRVEVLEAGIFSDGVIPDSPVVAASTVLAGSTACIPVPDAKLWTTDEPWIYPLRISIIRGGRSIDSVKGYTAIRSIGVVKDKMGYRRIALNGKSVFQFGTLDQGWWPDGLYTAPTEEAMVWDILKTKQMGFNMIRKHIKVEPARWYYWCDLLGMFVWQDMPSIADNHGDRSLRGNKFRAFGDERWFSNRSDSLVAAQTKAWSRDSFIGGEDCEVPQEWQDNYYKEWGNIISALKCFPSIVVWVPFNEAWGQFDSRRAAEFTKKADPTRLVNAASGGNYDFAGDIQDTHHYPHPAMNAFEGKMVNVVGEYGGIGYPVDGHLWKISDTNWGYGNIMHSGGEVLELYRKFAQRLKDMVPFGLSAGVYTQITDVEVEVNGLISYDREKIKIDISEIKEINSSVINSL